MKSQSTYILYVEFFGYVSRPTLNKIICPCHRKKCTYAWYLREAFAKLKIRQNQILYAYVYYLCIYTIYIHTQIYRYTHLHTHTCI